ncbi:hypothetical protein FRC19_002577 [Serendipita sp. 401]|nr:hypothetical protein FRC19_002577 [Serendipita sp. 401]KAG8839416.1 hypothetical protein FRC18_010896 [Serendipita sp. 400]KAG9057907.1 hypothetical protein FS842_002909 [Serendipita sp. 407]
MSFTQLAAKFTAPYIACTAVGVGLTGYFYYGNLALKYQGLLPYTDSRIQPTYPQRLDAWAWTYGMGKKHMGLSITIGTLVYTTAAILTPMVKLRLPLLIAAGLSASNAVWTLSLMQPINNRLSELAEKSKVDPLVPSTEVDDLIARWKRLHNVRLVLGASAYFTGVAVLLLSM